MKGSEPDIGFEIRGKKNCPARMPRTEGPDEDGLPALEVPTCRAGRDTSRVVQRCLHTSHPSERIWTTPQELHGTAASPGSSFSIRGKGFEEARYRLLLRRTPPVHTAAAGSAFLGWLQISPKIEPQYSRFRRSFQPCFAKKEPRTSTDPKSLTASASSRASRRRGRGPSRETDSRRPRERRR